MNTFAAELFGSSHYRAIADDALKDEDNAAWVMELEPEIQQAWIERIRWIRLADRLAESDLIGGSGQFQDFYAAWQWLNATGRVQPAGVHRSLFESIRQAWFNQPDQSCKLSQQAWERYLVALSFYNQKNLVFETIDAFETMLRELASSFFQVLPFLSTETWKLVGAFGAVDQFYNTLRDMREDAEQGICYLPTELLDRFGVTRAEILELRAHQTPGYRAMMQFWIYDYLPKLQRRAYPFILSPDLHPSWQVLRDWSLSRYRRIEQVMRRCDYNYVRFPEAYWRQVQRDLGGVAPSRESNATAPGLFAKPMSFADQRCKLRKFIALDSQGGLSVCAG